MPTVFDVATKIAELVPGARSDGKRLQKLVYYAQAWSLAWDERPLFAEPVEAWTNGPVVSHLYGAQRHDGGFEGNAAALDQAALETIAAVVAAYGDKPGAWLSELAHREQPWLEARKGLPREARSKVTITHESMRRWYQSQGIREKSLPPAYLQGLDVLVDTPEDEVALLLSEDLAPGEPYLQWLKKGDEAWSAES